MEPRLSLLEQGCVDLAIFSFTYDMSRKQVKRTTVRSIDMGILTNTEGLIGIFPVRKKKPA